MRWIAIALLPALLAAPVSAGSLAIVHVTVVDATGSPPQQDTTVLVRYGRIVALGRRAPVPAAAQVVDGRGKFLVPGLWDMHVHLRDEDHARAAFPLLLAAGITGVRGHRESPCGWPAGRG